MYLSACSVGEAHAIISGPHKAAAADVLRCTLVTFDIKLRSLKLFEWQQTVTQDLPRTGWVFVLGIFSTDLPLILGHVAAHLDLHVLMSYAEHNLRCLCFVRREADGATDRVFYATSLLHWADTKSQVKIARSYHAAVTNSSRWSPLGLRGFVVVCAMLALSEVTGGITFELLLQALYVYRMIFVGAGMTLGFFASLHPPVCGDSSHCLVNYGAFDIALWSMSRVA
ncbi:receptor-type adenylate cyclase [Trypanosoma rangeli]|uniref:Receptor-type adenylate cyclase n=1 Tax=Trypanosoma rangeli TaxID=5698 RepID=A0A422MSK7_TRYRA|nr:receptor-type adenylate cyclase [Trypanosoma rangeli]RNE96202.1 receptor-type adenylate cyclase [Trypanosoma rangeli]|eukprot:RNE96202.1 receptor-type adenylate cyclase [Trypanosoma rangeli]